jgi:hypothetical protein
MKKPKETARILTALSMVGYAVTAFSVILIPKAIDQKGNLTAFGYTAGCMFWIGLVFGLICFLFAWKTARRQPLYQKIRGWFGIGAFSFGKTKLALVTDILCAVALVVIILGNTVWHFRDILMISVLIIFIITFLWHFIVNGRVFIYAHHKRQIKASDMKPNLSKPGKES